MDKDGENIWKSAETANYVRQLVENKLEYIKLIRINAELRAEKYNALINEGFSKEEALHIVTNTLIFG